ncbi:MAG: hypothetical protein KF696_04525 [Planctomycetes bacterium]|nr:hypothetical protein [Planctomycetota bacterium]MCW8134238.1 hypothetical protein [Planctomycetota bacterium]
MELEAQARRFDEADLRRDYFANESYWQKLGVSVEAFIARAAARRAEERLKSRLASRLA